MSVLSRRTLLNGLFAAIAVGATGCGFRLRGTGPLAGASYKTVQLLGDEKVPSELVSALRQQWRGLGVELTDSISQADVVVQLGGYQRNISRTAFSATGETTSELIKLSQSFIAFRVEDDTEIINTEVMALRDRQTDPAQKLAAARELQDIERQMQQDLARQLIDRINRTYHQLPAVGEQKDESQAKPAISNEQPQ
ncbi:LPS assembly lipoprotein LptE [Thiomicrospira pelophila]|uniref:LPS-assembly lipoprotein LptE n=1 Tax=Thiomicrospira pelophila TaxID=934 RepID=UPI00068EA57A|nr:LPS assembly lipoprotein LptE [Thiomicrospira pelophila]